jgi:acetoin utilization deacetylase AcuC-like enzyme
MKIFYCDHFVLPLPPGHRFPIQKYVLLREQVMAAGLIPPQNLIVPEAATDQQILRVHDEDYLQRVKSGPLCRRQVGSTCFEQGRAGGTGPHGA